MNKERLEAFTDAIIAIAATIMVLELHAPKEITIQGFLQLWPVFLAYLISFSLIYIVWYNHHNLFKKATIISSKTFIFNGIWLFTLTLVPFTTALVGEHPHNALVQSMYLINLFLWSFTFHLMDLQIIKDNHVHNDATTSLFNRIILYGGFIISLISTFVLPYFSMIIMSVVIIILAIRLVFFDRDFDL